MARCVCCSRPLSSRRSPPSAGSPRRLPGCRSSCAAKVSTSSSSSPTTATWSCRTSRSIELDVPAWAGPARIRVGDHPIAGRLHLVDVPGMARSHPYLKPDGDGWPDNAERFFRFARAIAARVEQAPPDVLHLNDWHTGAALAALTVQPPTVVSIHNLAYQGVAPGTVAQADRSARRALRMVGRHQPAHRRLRVGRRDRRGVAELRAGDPHAGVRVRRERAAGVPGRCAHRHPQRHRHRGVGPQHRSAHRLEVRCRPPRSQGAQPRRAPRAPRLRGVRRATRRRRHPPDRSEGDRPPRAARVAARADPDAGRRARLRRRPPGRHASRRGRRASGTGSRSSRATTSRCRT